MEIAYISHGFGEFKFKYEPVAVVAAATTIYEKKSYNFRCTDFE